MSTFEEYALELVYVYSVLSSVLVASANEAINSRLTTLLDMIISLLTFIATWLCLGRRNSLLVMNLPLVQLSMETFLPDLMLQLTVIIIASGATKVSMK